MEKKSATGAQLVTVIIPYYNNTQIFECIQSVLDQSYASIELILADDGSRENLNLQFASYIRQNKRNNIIRFVILRNDVNQGTVKNINRALKESQGELIFTLAADDVFYDERVIEDWVNAFERDDSHVIMGFSAMCDETNQKILELSPDARQADLLRSSNTKKIWSALCIDNFILGCATARTAECVKQYGLVPECYRLIEDYPMNLYWYRVGVQITLFDRIVVRHRKGGVSSAINVSDTYIEDTKLIYEHEVFPYVRVKWFWRLHLKKQISLRIRESHYLHMRKKHDSLLWNIICHLVYPEIIYRYIYSHYLRRDPVVPSRTKMPK